MEKERKKGRKEKRKQETKRRNAIVRGYIIYRSILSKKKVSDDRYYRQMSETKARVHTHICARARAPRRRRVVGAFETRHCSIRGSSIAQFHRIRVNVPARLRYRNPFAVTIDRSCVVIDRVRNFFPFLFFFFPFPFFALETRPVPFYLTGRVVQACWISNLANGSRFVREEKDSSGAVVPRLLR